MTVRIITEDIDKKERAVIIDGRLFYDLAYLIEQFRPMVDSHIQAGTALGGEDAAYADGEDSILEAIEESFANLTLEHDMGV